MGFSPDPHECGGAGIMKANRVQEKSTHSRLSVLILAWLCLGLGCGPPGNANRTAEGFWWPEEPVSPAQKKQEAEAKLARVRDLLRREKLGGLLIGKADDFSWISAGGDNSGEALLYIRDDGRNFLIGPEGRLKQLMTEDAKDLDCEGKVLPWYASEAATAAVAEISGGRESGTDIPFGGARLLESEIRALRTPLTESEIAKYRWLGKACGQALSDAAHLIRPYMTERGIDALVSAALEKRAIHAVNIRVAADARMSLFPDVPSSDGAKVERLVRIEVHARRWGMDAALTRCVHFGPLPEDIRRKQEASAAVVAGYWARTLPGATAGALLEGAIADYAAAGFPDEWKSTDQGGAIGYGGWDWLARPGSQDRARSGQTFAWHPSVGGVRIEETILVQGENLEILTQTDDWPVAEARSLGRIYRVPAILVR